MAKCCCVRGKSFAPSDSEPITVVLSLAQITRACDTTLCWLASRGAIAFLRWRLTAYRIKCDAMWPLTNQVIQTTTFMTRCRQSRKYVYIQVIRVLNLRYVNIPIGQQTDTTEIARWTHLLSSFFLPVLPCVQCGRVYLLIVCGRVIAGFELWLATGKIRSDATREMTTTTTARRLLWSTHHKERTRCCWSYDVAKHIGFLENKFL